MDKITEALAEFPRQSLLYWLCGNHPDYRYVIEWSRGKYYLRKWYRDYYDYSRVMEVDYTLIVRLRDYKGLLDENLMPTDKAFKVFWCKLPID